MRWAKFLSVILTVCACTTVGAQKLAIHYINTGQGGSTLIIGPDGTKVLYDFGVKGGKAALVPYLHALLHDDKKIDYAILSHRHKDHYYGYFDMVEAGIDVRVANFEPDGPKLDSSQLHSNWYIPAEKTTAGKVRTIPVGLAISLGDSATMYVVAANGILMDGTRVDVVNENDRSVVLFISYKNFQYLIDGDLGGGTENCSGHQTTQTDVQTYVAKTLINQKLITSEYGVDALHIAHHGSESSSPLRYIALMKPEIGLVSVGNPNCKYRHPRRDVISPLISAAPEVTPLLGSSFDSCPSIKTLQAIYQTDKGTEDCDLMPIGKETLNDGIIGGDIILTTNGNETYTIKTTGRVFLNGVKSQNGVVHTEAYCVDEYETEDEQNEQTCTARKP